MMTRNIYWLAIVYLTFGAVTAGFADEFTFKKSGKLVKSMSYEDLKTFVAKQLVPVFEPHADADRTYEALPFAAVLDKIYGPTWRTDDEFLFTATDGYMPTITVENLKKHETYLAYAWPGGPEFTVIDRNEKVDLGPFYLVWENQKDLAVRAQGAHNWPYKLVSVDLIRYSERYPHLAPPKTASASVQRGFLIFKGQCQMCHAINGEGGLKGVELNYPMNVTEYWKEKMLRQWIDKPESIRISTAMPGLDKSLKGKAREQTLNDLISYLKEMAKHKFKPEAAQ